MTQFNFGDLRRALEDRDGDLLVSLYADDAEIQIVNQNRPPSSPFEARGKSAVQTYLFDVCSRDMTHEIGREVLTDDRVSDTELCRYPDGVAVLGANVLEIADGKITSHVSVESWDG